MAGAISTPMWPRTWNSNPTTCFSTKYQNPTVPSNKIHSFSHLSYKFPFHFSLYKNNVSAATQSSLRASSSSSSVGSAGYVEEPATKVRFLKSLILPGCSSSLSLLGTGYREKVFAIIGVKVYAAGLYVNQSISNTLNAWKGQSATKIEADPALFSSIFQAPLEKSLQIVLVRDIDGKTFWDALDEAVTPRVNKPTPADEVALSIFRGIFEHRSLKKGTFIFLTWLGPSNMLVCISSDGMPSRVDAEIDSENVTSALFDVFFGKTPVSPSLKASVANFLESVLSE